MADEVADMVTDLIVLIVDGKSAQDPVEVGFPVSLVAADGSAKGDDSFGTSDALARPDLNPEAVGDGLALRCHPHSACVCSIAAPYVAPFMEPAGRAFVVGARGAIRGAIHAAYAGARRERVSCIDVRVVGLLREQGVGQDAGRDWSGLLLLGVVVFAFGALDDLVRFLVEMEPCATRKEWQRDRRSDRLDSSSARHRSHASPPAPSEIRVSRHALR